jgi:superfamily I DNA/RNA helicase
MEWRLDLTVPPPAPAPVLDADQQAVVAHTGGPLLVLAGPGTGKTTTIVESVAARIPSIAAGQILVLTFGRRAAREVRDRIAARLGGGPQPHVSTFHSFAYSLVREFAPDGEYLDPPRLLSGAEEDVRIRELLLGAAADGHTRWPDDLTGALGTLGLANEVRSMIARMREWGISPARLRRIAEETGRPAWSAVAAIAEADLAVMALENVQDYTELMRRAVEITAQSSVRARINERYRAVYVDEYQDTDPLQTTLLGNIVTPASTLVAVGDPDQAIYAFRGADIRGIVDFPERFRTSAGTPAPIVVLGSTRRFGPRIRTAVSAVLPPAPYATFGIDVMKRHRSPTTLGAGRDEIRVQRFDSESACAEHVAAAVRRSHVLDGVPWSDLAVLVRNGDQLVGIERSLQRLGVPVAVSADEIPLRSEPAVARILEVLRLATHPQRSTAMGVVDVLTGPIGGCDAASVRGLGRLMRRLQVESDAPITPSREAIRAAILDHESVLDSSDLALAGTDETAVARARALRALISRVRTMIRSQAPIDEVLWQVWTGGEPGHGWPRRLRAAALAGSSSAHHDIDSVMALFDAAERAAERYRGVVGVTSFLSALDSQEIPAEPVAERAARGDAVRLLTAHRAKGLEFERVWVVGAQEGVWPDLRERGSALELSALAEFAEPGVVSPTRIDIEERNLFYVACTRAREQLNVCVVDGGDDGADEPSRFIDDVLAGGAADERVSGHPQSLTTWDGLVAELRGALMDPGTPSDDRAAAAELLAAAASLRDATGAALVPLADPVTWWGAADVTVGQRPVRDETQPIAMSGSRLDDLIACPLKWFLEQDVRAETPRGSATQFGSIIHAVAEYIAKGEASPEEVDVLIERVWGRVPFQAGWQSESERRAAQEALARFLAYHAAAQRELVATECNMRADIEVATVDGPDTVRLTGFADRIERDADGRLVPIDLKNMKNPPPDSKVPEHGQLGVYQLLIERDPPADLDTAVSGGAALVQLREGTVDGFPKVQFQAPITDDPMWIVDRLGEAVSILRREEFTPRVGKHCDYCAFKASCPTKPISDDLVPQERP